MAEQTEVEGEVGEQAHVDVEAAKPGVRIGILTISDRASRGEMEDLSGPAIQKAVAKSKLIVAVYACIPDDRKLISRTLRRWADEDLCDCILTTGGTGLSARDVTPESTLRILDQTLPHLSTYIALQGVKSAPTAILSRGIAGARGRTLIVNLPGSPDGAATGARIVAGVATHAVAVLRGDAAHTPAAAPAKASENGAHADL